MPWSPRSRLPILVAALAVAGCGATFRPFSSEAITWRDPDRARWGPRPAPRRSTAMWDATEGMFFRPQLRALAVERPRQSVDVNALDEVPDSSWFENRIGRTPMSPREVARGACDSIDTAPPRPWRVVAMKTGGSQRGLFLEDAANRRWLLEIDHARQPERATAAEVVVAALLHASGYHVPCNRIVFFTDEDLRVDPDGPPRSEVRAVVAAAARAPDGRRRASVSGMLPDALGPWRYSGVWEADVNDRVPHELRRELRALRYFAGWVDHLDARAENTLSVWVGDENEGFVRHALIDFGDALGATDSDPRRSARRGYSALVDPTASLEDFVTLGMLPRPWHRDAADPRATLGDFATEPFDPGGWHPNFDNGAFEHADASDAAWAARIVARFGPAHLRALAEQARFSDPRTTERLVEALRRRRDAILEAHLTRRSPLTEPRVDGGRLCLEDVAVVGGIRAPDARRDRARTQRVDGPSSAAPVTRDDERVCVGLPAPVRGYLVVDVWAATPELDAPGPARVHLTARRGRYRVLGLERPAPGDAGPP